MKHFSAFTVFVLFLSLLGLFSSCLSAKPPQYTVTDLGLLGGTGPGNSSLSNGLNDLGQVVGWSEIGDGFIHAFLYSKGVMTDLGSLPGMPASSALAINNLGEVVGVSVDNNNANEAFLYSNGVLTSLGNLGGNSSSAWDINDGGQIVGESWLESGKSFHAFLSFDGKVSDLGTLGTGIYSQAIAINNIGDIVGYSTTSKLKFNNNNNFNSFNNLNNNELPPYSAFLYSNGKMNQLNGLGSNSFALGINDAGDVVGYNGATDSAFLSSNGVVTNLGTLGGMSVAYDINNAGQIVGNSQLSQDSPLTAFIFMNQTMYNLADLIPSDSGYSQIQLIGYHTINNVGQIAATGTLGVNGASRALLLTPVL